MKMTVFNGRHIPLDCDPEQWKLGELQRAEWHARYEEHRRIVETREILELAYARGNTQRRKEVI